MSQELDWNDDEAVVRAAVGKLDIYGPSGDGCHIASNGGHIGYGNCIENMWKSARVHPTVVAWEKAHRPAPVEGVVLPELDVTSADMEKARERTDDAIWVPWQQLSCRERQLAQAIAQRDEAREYVTRMCAGYIMEDHWSLKERAEKAEAALATARAELNGWRERTLNAESIIFNRPRLDTGAERSIDL